MSEQVIHEIRVIETEDGFRIEMKGNKEELRRMLFERGFGPGGGHGFGRRKHRHHGHGRPWFARPFGGGHGPRHEHPVPGYDLGPWWDEGEASEKPKPGEA